MTSNRSLSPVPYSDNLNIGTYNHVAGDQIITTTYNINLTVPSDPTCPPFNAAPLDFLSGNFMGREQEMRLVIEFLETLHGDVPSRCALHGMHGVGKSQVSYALAKDLFDRGRYTYIFYIQATSIEELYQGFFQLLYRVSHPERYAPEREARLLAARCWLEDFTGGTWLLIFDNVAGDRETVKFLRNHLPRKNRHGSILFTTLTRSIAEALTDVAGQQRKIVELHVPDVDDAAKLLLKHLGNDPAAIADETNVRDIVQAVGCLPLAVAQVAEYMAQSCISITRLAALLKGEHKIKVMCHCYTHCLVHQLAPHS